MGLTRWCPAPGLPDTFIGIVNSVAGGGGACSELACGGEQVEQDNRDQTTDPDTHIHALPPIAVLELRGGADLTPRPLHPPPTPNAVITDSSVASVNPSVFNTPLYYRITAVEA